MKRVLFACAVVSVVAVSACFIDNGTATLAVPSEGGAGGSTLGAVGGKCDDLTPCRPGLVCNANVCAPGHTLDDGAACVISAECKKGDYCGPKRTCTASGKGATGDSCQADGDCQSGLRCNITGLSAVCQPEGMGDVGAVCKTSADCFGGLACTGGACTPLPPSTGGGPLVVPTWKGVDCTEDTSQGAIAYFRVPRGTKDDGDFFRLPFPNDVRTKGGHPSLTNFPTPGTEILGYDVVDRYARYVETTATGYSSYTSIIMRFNEEPDLGTLGGTGVLRLVDFTAGQDVGFQWAATTGRSPYVCANSITARPLLGAPFAPGHTYGFIMSNAVKTKAGKPFGASSDFKAMVGAAAPAAPLDVAYATWKPLRDWAAAHSYDLGAAINATVFTVDKPQDLASGLQKAVTAAAAPAATQWVKCDGATKSPCPQADADRACPATPDPAFDELHALVSLPIFQKGTAPYLNPADGGDIATDATGTPVLSRTESVCMSLTVPKGAPMPASGWPVVVYAHGTGGSFRSAINEGVAKMLSSIDGGPGLAVLGIDQVEHGPRRGASTDSPNNLFFNFTNPAAARGNALQGAADQMSLIRFATGFDLAANASPTATQIKFGPVAFWGHSQGATEGGIALPYTTGVGGVVLTGEGGSLIDGLLGKRSPINIADVLPFVLEDTSVGEGHPVLSLLQNAIDPADPLNHASAMAATPVTTAKNVFMVYGQKDTYAPNTTQNVYATAAALAQVAPVGISSPDKIGDGSTNPAPYGGNVGKLTAVTRQYAPSLYDGHFVGTKNPQAVEDIGHFLYDVGQGNSPILVGR
jgi:hypothetical protein